MSAVEQYLDAHASAFESQLIDWLSIPSVSAASRHRADVDRAADWLVEQFRSLGCSVGKVATTGHPIVLAEAEPQAGSATTLLIYGHYDVQPPDPLDQWVSGPFNPTVRNGCVYARGASDDKGQLFAHVKALEAWQRTAGAPPVRVKFVVEGEEEVGSAQLFDYIETHKARLAADYAVLSDTAQFAPGVPAITYGLRGLAYFEVILRGPSQDLHSGTHGGGVVNPANALATVLASLKDDRARVAVPGFYDDVVPLAQWERQAFAALPFDEEAYGRTVGVPALTGEEGFTTLERRWARPTCDVNGLYGGYGGEGAKTIIPATAGAKISFRLVPDQDPERIAEAFESHVRRVCPAGVCVAVERVALSPGVLVPTDGAGVQAARRAMRHGFGADPVLIREGGSIPVVTSFKQQLGIDSLILGFGLPDDNAHAPNEKLCLADFHRGVRTSAYLLGELRGA